MRNPFPPWKPGFYRLVRNTGCLDKSNLSCSICICIRRQRALRRLRVGTHRRGRVPFEIRVFANTRAHTPLFSLSLSSLRVSPYLFISASALTSSHPRREKSPSSLLLLLLEFSIVPLNFVPRLSRLAIEVFCGLSFISKRLLPAFPLLPLWRANRQRWSNRQVCSFWIAKRMYFGGEGGGVRRCSWQTMRDIWTHDIYIYIRICGEEVESPRGRGTWSRRAMRDHRGWTRLFSSVELARRRERSEKGWVPRGTTMRSGVKRWRGLYLEAKGTYWIELNDAYGEIRSLAACDVSSIGA